MLRECVARISFNTHHEIVADRDKPPSAPSCRSPKLPVLAGARSDRSRPRAPRGSSSCRPAGPSPVSFSRGCSAAGVRSEAGHGCPARARPVRVEVSHRRAHGEGEPRTTPTHPGSARARRPARHWYIPPPAVRVGQRVTCFDRDTKCVTSISDAPIPWPRVRAVEHRDGSGLGVRRTGESDPPAPRARRHSSTTSASVPRRCGAGVRRSGSAGGRPLRGRPAVRAGPSSKPHRQPRLLQAQVTAKNRSRVTPGGFVLVLCGC